MNDKEFIAYIKPFAIKDMKENDILASLTIAQAFIESNKGSSGLTVRANNLFGIKGSYNDKSVKMLTTEYVNGKPTKTYADFRAYPTWLESINDHSAFLRKYKRYASIIGEHDYKKACEKMGASGYATSPTYGQTLLKTVERYKLYEIDNEVLGTNFKPTATPQEEKPIYKIGKTYVLQVNLNVRVAPNGEQMLFGELTKDGKLHSYDDGNGAVMRKGTKITCKDIKEVEKQTWIKCPSGWICAINDSKVYIK